jgi:hypothetical protein
MILGERRINIFLEEGEDGGIGNGGNAVWFY